MYIHSSKSSFHNKISNVVFYLDGVPPVFFCFFLSASASFSFSISSTNFSTSSCSRICSFFKQSNEDFYVNNMHKNVNNQAILTRNGSSLFIMANSKFFAPDWTT